jgi:hypothetical protein
VVARRNNSVQVSTSEYKVRLIALLLHEDDKLAEWQEPHMMDNANTRWRSYFIYRRLSACRQSNLLHLRMIDDYKITIPLQHLGLQLRD